MLEMVNAGGDGAAELRIEVDSAKQQDKYYDEFEDAIGGTIKHIDSGRTASDAMMVLMVLAIGGVASYQSYMFAGKFVSRILGPEEANAPAWLQAVLPKMAGVSAYSANAAIPVISSDVALLATMNIFSCLLSGIATALTLGCVGPLNEMRKKHEWQGVGAFGYSLLVLGLSIAGSVANTEAAYDSVKTANPSWMWAVTATSAIVQLLQNSRAVKLMLSKDTSHLKKHRLECQKVLLPQQQQKQFDDSVIHAMSMGQKKLLPMWLQVTTLSLGLIFASTYNYTSAIKLVLTDNAEWQPVWRYGLAGINFLVKTVLLTRAFTNQSRRILSAEKVSAAKKVGYAGLVFYGMLSMGSAAEYPKKYLFNDDQSFEHSMMSVGLAEVACLALNLGDMYDAGKIIFSFMYNKLLMQWVLGIKPTPEQRYGKTYAEMIEKSMNKTMQQDEAHLFHHREYEQGHDHDDYDHNMVAVSAKPRNAVMTACNLQAGYQPLDINMGFVAMGGSEYHVKPAGSVGLESWRKQAALRQKIFSDNYNALPDDMDQQQKNEAARNSTNAKLNSLHGEFLANMKASERLGPSPAA
ncbi:MAG: hypothetical protein P1U40_08585 [Coxiellaceae bacterium]|nr:hypothetical protein [Coxiellaceae bacterium]